MPKKNQRVGLSGILLFLALAVVCAGAIYLAAREMSRSETTSDAPAETASTSESSRPPRSDAAEPAPEPYPPGDAGIPSPDDVEPVPETPRPLGDSLPPVPSEGFTMPEPRGRW